VRLIAGVAFLIVLSSLAAVGQSVPRLQWIINGPALKYFAADSFARTFFDNTQPFVIKRKDDALVLPGGWRSQEVRSFTSYPRLEAAFANGTIGPEVRAILYDNEAWKFTPQGEQLQCVQYTERAAQLVHAHGLLLIAAPAVDLVRTLDPEHTGKRYDRFLQLGLIGGVARSADIVVVQAQGSENNGALYSNFVRSAAAQAKAQNPHLLVFAGISTNPSGQKVTAEQIVDAIRATSSSVDGYWFNVPAPGPYCPRCNKFRPELAVEVLRRLGESRPMDSHF
jgi:hypothetical protein